MGRIWVGRFPTRRPGGVDGHDQIGIGSVREHLEGISGPIPVSRVELQNEPVGPDQREFGIAPPEQRCYLIRAHRRELAGSAVTMTPPSAMVRVTAESRRR